MGAVARAAYVPNERDADAYDLLYAEYLLLHDWFGRGGNDVMERAPSDARGGRRRRSSHECLRRLSSRPRSPRRAPRSLACTRELVRYGLVAWTAGNVSGRVRGR